MQIIEPSPPTGSDFFNSLWKTQTWINILYLLLSFPLGIFYFVVLVTGISLGFGLLITIVGIFILMGVMLLVHLFARFEIQLANALLGFQIRPAQIENSGGGFWKRLREKLRSPLTWKGLLFLFLRFPMGILAFSLTVSLLAASIGMISLPFIYQEPWFDMDWGYHSFWHIDSISETIVVAFFGIILVFTSLYVFNVLAWAYGKLVKVLLGE